MFLCKNTTLQIAMILRVFEHALFSRLKVQMRRIRNRTKALELAAVIMRRDIILGAYLGFTHHEIEYKKL
jgi:hypothetical protein